LYIWQQPDWPAMHWDHKGLSGLLATVSHDQGRLLGQMEGLGFGLRSEAHLQSLTEEVVTSSEIEGEKLPVDQVRSSIARRLGMDAGGLVPAERNVEGIVDMTVDATDQCDQPLDAERLFGWHAALFPTGRSGMRRITVGRWRDDASGPMQVVSGPVGREKAHYEAPPADRVVGEEDAGGWPPGRYVFDVAGHWFGDLDGIWMLLEELADRELLIHADRRRIGADLRGIFHEFWFKRPIHGHSPFHIHH